MINTVIKKKRKSKKYIFTLHNINTEKIEQKYGITIVSNIANVDEAPPENSTKLTELAELNNEHVDVISFLDETKRLYQCHISMIDFKSGEDIKNLKYCCYWCRHKFESASIGCPIKYISKKAVKNYYSEVSKDFYTIKENITRNRSLMLHNNKSKFVFCHIVTPVVADEMNKDLKKQQDDVETGGDVASSSSSCSININNRDYYSTDGIFCSFNCCKAFIKENKHNKLYENSDILLTKLYQDMYNVKNIVINPSPHWRLLIEYGGYLTIQQFRDNFNKTTYESHGVIRNTDIFKPIATLYEEKLNF
jgi:hypothetical protein